MKLSSNVRIPECKCVVYRDGPYEKRDSAKCSIHEEEDKWFEIEKKINRNRNKSERSWKKKVKNRMARARSSQKYKRDIGQGYE